MAKLLSTWRKYILVIEISKTGLKIAYFLRSGTRLELINYSLEKIDPELDSSAQITNYIRAFLAKNSLSIKEAILSIADTDSVAIKYCLLPPLKRKEILSAAIWQLKDEVHFDLENAYSDWRIVKEFTDEQGARQQGIIFAFSRKEIVEKHLQCLAQCNLRVLAIVTSALNYTDILRNISLDKDISSEIVLEFEYMDTALNIYVDKKLHFCRCLPVSLQNFTNSLVGTLLSDKGKVELGLREAEEIRDNIGIPEDEAVFIKDNLRASQIASLIRPILESLVREIRHSVNYFTSNMEGSGPQVIYIAGLGANLKNLDKYLAKELGLRVTKLPLPDILETGRIQPARLSEDKSQLVSCAGAVLSAGRGLSLMAGDVRMRWVKNVLLKRLAPFAAVIGIAALSFMIISLLALPVYSYRLKAAKSYFNDKKNLLSFFQKVQVYRELVFEVSLQRVTADAFLNFIGKSVPDDLRLNGLELDQYRGELILQGEAGKTADLDTFVNTLKASDFFVNVKPVGLTRREFKIKCKLKY